MKLGRNDKCNCGSGLKFKKCCLGKENSSVSSEVCTPITLLFNTNQFELYVSQILNKELRLRFIQIYFNLRASELHQSCQFAKKADPFHALQRFNFGLSDKVMTETGKIPFAFHSNEKKWLQASEFIFVNLSKSPLQGIHFEASIFSQNSTISHHVSSGLLGASKRVQQDILRDGYAWSTATEVGTLAPRPREFPVAAPYRDLAEVWQKFKAIEFLAFLSQPIAGEQLCFALTGEEFFLGYGSFVNLLAKRTKKSPITTSDQLQKYQLFQIFEAQSNYKISLRLRLNDAFSKKVFKASLLSEISESNESLNLISLFSKDQELTNTFKAAWANLLLYSFIPKNCLPTLKTILAEIFDFNATGSTKTGEKSGAKNGTEANGLLWRLDRSSANATIDDVNLLMTIKKIESLGLHEIRQRGLDFKGGFEVILSDQSKVSVLTNPLQLFVNREFLGSPWSQVEEAVRWAIFMKLRDEYSKAGQSEGSAEVLASKRSGFKLRGFKINRMSAERDSQDFKPFSEEADFSESEKRILEKVNKLFSLGQSSNTAEAELAMARAQELLKKSRLDVFASTGSNVKSETRMERLSYIFSSNRVSRVISSILGILGQHYGVRVIHRSFWNANSCEDQKGADLLGQRMNILMAEHVADFLCQQVNSLWEMALKSQHGHQAKQKLSFQLGVLAGFSQKLQNEKSAKSSKDQSPEAKQSEVNENALIALEESEIEDFVGSVYPSLSSRSRQAYSIDKKAFEGGKLRGSEITLNKPIERADNSTQETKQLRLT